MRRNAIGFVAGLLSRLSKTFKVFLNFLSQRHPSVRELLEGDRLVKSAACFPPNARHVLAAHNQGRNFFARLPNTEP
jgi:hypothetical protein